jgi:cytochrome c-type biogenesis protein
MSALSPFLALIAGVLSILSPCVLPLLPIVFGSAASKHRWGPVALASGMAISFTAVGLFVATVGFAVGLDADLMRKVGGGALLLVGLVLIAPALRRQLAVAAGPVTNWGQAHLASFDGAGVGAQAALGALLGLVWSPCVGPTLGAASLLAAQGHQLGDVALVMLSFGLGAAGALAAVGYATQRSMSSWKGRLREAGESGRRLLGAALVFIALIILSGLDRSVEGFLVAHSPGWLTSLTTRF